MVKLAENKKLLTHSIANCTLKKDAVVLEVVFNAGKSNVMGYYCKRL